MESIEDPQGEARSGDGVGQITPPIVVADDNDVMVYASLDALYCGLEGFAAEDVRQAFDASGRKLRFLISREQAMLGGLILSEDVDYVVEFSNDTSQYPEELRSLLERHLKWVSRGTDVSRLSIDELFKLAHIET